MNLSELLRGCALDLLDTEQRVTIDQVVDCAYAQDPAAFQAEQERLVRNAAHAQVRALMRDLAEDEDDPQLSLPGLSLPSTLAIADENGNYSYVRTDKAIWKEIQMGRNVRARNVERAQAKLDSYDDALDYLRPAMELDPMLTVAEAIERLGDEGAAA